MYASHVPAIRSYSVASPDNLTDCLTFVLATIQQGLSTVPAIMDDIDRHGDASKFLFGSKRDGYRYITDNAKPLHTRTLQLQSAREAVELFYGIPGIGAVKAGFCAQLLGFETGCIDSHNLTAYGIPASAVTIPKRLKPETISRKLQGYVSLTVKLGGAATLWDNWCHYVAGNQANKALPDGETVSRLHLQAITRNVPAELFAAIEDF